MQKYAPDLKADNIIDQVNVVKSMKNIRHEAALWTIID